MSWAVHTFSQIQSRSELRSNIALLKAGRCRWHRQWCYMSKSSRRCWRIAENWIYHHRRENVNIHRATMMDEISNFSYWIGLESLHLLGVAWIAFIKLLFAILSPFILVPFSGQITSSLMSDAIWWFISSVPTDRPRINLRNI
jgi:hypothetical protein